MSSWESKLSNLGKLSYFTEAFIGILEYMIKKEILEEMKTNYVYEDDASSLHPKRV